MKDQISQSPESGKKSPVAESILNLCFFGGAFLLIFAGGLIVTFVSELILGQSKHPASDMGLIVFLCGIVFVGSKLICERLNENKAVKELRQDQLILMKARSKGSALTISEAALECRLSLLLLSLLLLSLLLLLQAQAFANSGIQLNISRHKAASGRKYLIIESANCSCDFELKRPSQQDEKVLLCIPAAFTSKEGGLCGLYAKNGQIANEKAVDMGIGGAAVIKNGELEIIDTNSGQHINRDFVQNLKDNKFSFFQQFQIIKGGNAESFRDKSHFQRRCIATRGDKKVCVIESDSSITFNEFAHDLLDIGVDNAIYTDMGPWSEGWYRDAKAGVVKIGESRYMTDRQTNWFVLKKNPGN